LLLLQCLSPAACSAEQWPAAATTTVETTPSPSPPPAATATATATATGSITASSTASATASPQPPTGTATAVASVAATPSLTATPSPSPAGTPENPEWLKYVLCIGIACIGIAQAGWGFRLFRVTLFIMAFGLAATLTYVPIVKYVVIPSAPWIALAAAGCAGVVAGWYAARRVRTGVFLVGAGCGAVLGVMLNAAVLYKLYPSQPGVTMLAGAGVVGLACGCLALCLLRIVVIVGTSLAGCFGIVYGIGSLLPQPATIPNVFDVASQLDAAGSVPTATYYYFGAVLVAAMAAILWQLHSTSKSSSPSRAAASPGGAGAEATAFSVAEDDAWEAAVARERAARARRRGGTAAEPLLGGGIQ